VARADVVIRRYRRDDAATLLEAALDSTERIFPWMPWCHGTYSLAESQTWIDHCDATWTAGTEYNFAIVDDADQSSAAVGSTS
jgi:RimJ/RimL family protein N-acetyltransferase